MLFVLIKANARNEKSDRQADQGRRKKTNPEKTLMFIHKMFASDISFPSDIEFGCMYSNIQLGDSVFVDKSLRKTNVLPSADITFDWPLKSNLIDKKSYVTLCALEIPFHSMDFCCFFF